MIRERTLTGRLVEQLYAEALLLADELRGHFGRLDGEAAADPGQRVAFACEALAGTTRLMQAIAWLLGRRALAEGEADAAADRLGLARAPDESVIAAMGPKAQTLLIATGDLYERVRRLDESDAGAVPASPARSLLHRLERSL